VAAGTTVYTLDRWLGISGQAPGAFNMQRIADTTYLGDYQMYVSMAVADASLAAGDLYLFGQLIEGNFCRGFNWGNAQAQPITISFEVKGSSAFTLPLAIRNAAFNRSWLGSFNVTTGWTKVTMTVPGDTTGTWDTSNLVGVNILIGLGIGATFQGTAGWNAGSLLGLAGMTNFAGGANGLNLKNFQLEAGSVATTFERVAYDEQLARCQRYYEILEPAGGAAPGFDGNVTTGSPYLGWGSFRTTKRAAPTVVLTHYNASGFPLTAGTVGTSTYGYVESRTATSTSNGGFFQSSATASAEL
jgi:hypothetical protein